MDRFDFPAVVLAAARACPRPWEGAFDDFRDLPFDVLLFDVLPFANFVFEVRLFFFVDPVRRLGFSERSSSIFFCRSAFISASCFLVYFFLRGLPPDLIVQPSSPTLGLRFRKGES